MGLLVKCTVQLRYRQLEELFIQLLNLKHSIPYDELSSNYLDTNERKWCWWKSLKSQYVQNDMIILFLFWPKKYQVWSFFTCFVLCDSIDFHNTGCQKGLEAQSTLFMDEPPLQVTIWL